LCVTVAAAQQSLGRVRLKELPEWLSKRSLELDTFSSPALGSGWRWYYKRYIDVRRGGVGGLGMLLAGYCVISYIWAYPHMKRDRWRKHH
uniref:Uncharacterized protein n=1 Tax=Mola mola TaxID=94237 RepID=A0A3Q4BYC2_MOLML